jgi:hypothetical protein
MTTLAQTFYALKDEVETLYSLCSDERLDVEQFAERVMATADLIHDLIDQVQEPIAVFAVEGPDFPTRHLVGRRKKVCAIAKHLSVESSIVLATRFAREATDAEKRGVGDADLPYELSDEPA